MFHSTSIIVGNIFRKYFDPLPRAIISNEHDDTLCKNDEEYYKFLSNNRIEHCYNGQLQTQTLAQFRDTNKSKLKLYTTNADICLEISRSDNLIMSTDNALIYCEDDRTKPAQYFDLGILQNWTVDSSGFKFVTFNTSDVLPICPTDQKYSVSLTMPYGIFKVTNQFRFCTNDNDIAIGFIEPLLVTREKMYQFTRDCLKPYKNIDAHWLNFLTFDIPFCQVFDDKNGGIQRPLNIFQDFVGDYLPMKFVIENVLPKLPNQLRNQFVFNLRTKMIQLKSFCLTTTTTTFDKEKTLNELAILGTQQKYYIDRMNQTQMCPEVFDFELNECNTFENTNLAWFHTNHSSKPLDCVLTLFQTKIIAVLKKPTRQETNQIYSITLYKNASREAPLKLIYPTIICTVNSLPRVLILNRYELGMRTNYYLQYIDPLRVAVHTPTGRILLYEIHEDDRKDYAIHSPQLPLPFRINVCGSESKSFPTPFLTNRQSSRIISDKNNEYQKFVLCEEDNTFQRMPDQLCPEGQIYNFLNNQCVVNICQADETLHIPFTDSIISCRQGRVYQVNGVEREIFQTPYHRQLLEDNTTLLVWDQKLSLMRYLTTWKAQEHYYVVGPVCYFQELFQEIVQRAIENGRELQESSSSNSCSSSSTTIPAQRITNIQPLEISQTTKTGGIKRKWNELILTDTTPSLSSHSEIMEPIEDDTTVEPPTTTASSSSKIKQIKYE